MTQVPRELAGETTFDFLVSNGPASHPSTPATAPSAPSATSAPAEDIADAVFRGRTLVAQKKYSEAVPVLRQAIARNSASAMFEPGSLCEKKGLGLPQNYSDAMTLCLRAAYLKEGRAMTALGVLHEAGNGVPRDYLEALRWFHTAADAGDPLAMKSIGRLYNDGRGIPCALARLAEKHGLSDRGSLGGSGARNRFGR